MRQEVFVFARIVYFLAFFQASSANSFKSFIGRVGTNFVLSKYPSIKKETQTRQCVSVKLHKIVILQFCFCFNYIVGEPRK